MSLFCERQINGWISISTSFGVRRIPNDELELSALNIMSNMQGTTIHEYESDTTIEDQTTAAKLRQNLVVIPVIPRPLAIFCLVANITLPGSGTIVSGFSVFCFYYKKNNFLEMTNICIGNVLVGFAQLVTVIFLLIGWFWSIIWGCALVGHSNYYKQDAIVKPIKLTVKAADSAKDEGWLTCVGWTEVRFIDFFAKVWRWHLLVKNLNTFVHEFHTKLVYKSC